MSACQVGVPDHELMVCTQEFRDTGLVRYLISYVCSRHFFYVESDYINHVVSAFGQIYLHRGNVTLLQPSRYKLRPLLISFRLPFSSSFKIAHISFALFSMSSKFLLVTCDASHPESPW
jgi:hypothetical protein